MNAPKILNALSRLGVLGNAISREYDIGRETGQAGLWKIHTATKKSTGQRVSAFIFDKKLFDSPIMNLSNQEREQVCELLKREAMQLTRLRHPSVLEVVEAVDESRTSIAFATEPLLATLGDLVHGRRRGQVADDGEPFELDELEIQKGLLQLAKGLQFCHQDAHLVHGNLTPDSVFVNTKGDWKLGGLAFSMFTNRPSGSPGNELLLTELEDLLPDNCLPTRDYMAAERAFDHRIDFPSDIFSLGCIIHAVYYNGEPPVRSGRSNGTHKASLDALSDKAFEQIPVGLRGMVHQLLNRTPESRPTAAAFQQCSHFDNLLVSTIRFLETFCEKSREQKMQFLKGLSRVLPEFPDRALKKKVLTLLLEEIKDHSLLPLVLPNILFIAEKTSSIDFTNRVLPCLKPLFSMKEPAAAVLALLDKTSVLQKKTSAAVFKEEVLPLVVNALDSTTPAVQERALKVLPTVAEELDYTITLYCTTNVLSVKVNTLICFHAMLKTLDKYTIVERLLPMLSQARSREPAVTMASLVVYDEIGRNHLDKEEVATVVIPELWKMCIDPALNLAQFNKFMQSIYDLSDKIKTIQLKHLGEMKRMNEPTSTVSSTNNEVKESLQVTMNDFESLVAGKTTDPSQYAISSNNSNNDNDTNSMLFASLVGGNNTTNIKSTTTSIATDPFSSFTSDNWTKASSGTSTPTNIISKASDHTILSASKSLSISTSMASMSSATTASIMKPSTPPSKIPPIPMSGSTTSYSSNTANSLSSLQNVTPLFPPPPPPSSSSSTMNVNNNSNISSSSASNIFTSLPDRNPLITSNHNSHVNNSFSTSSTNTTTASSIFTSSAPSMMPLLPMNSTAPAALSSQPLLTQMSNHGQYLNTSIGGNMMSPLSATTMTSVNATPPLSSSSSSLGGGGGGVPSSRKNYDLTGFDPLL